MSSHMSAELLTSYLRNLVRGLSRRNLKNRILPEALRGMTIEPGSKDLELNSGTDECTVVLADHVGLDGHVTAVDTINGK